MLLKPTFHSITRTQGLRLVTASDSDKTLRCIVLFIPYQLAAYASAAFGFSSTDD